MGVMLPHLVLLLTVELVQGCIQNVSSFTADYPSSSRGENVWAVGVDTVEFNFNVTCGGLSSRDTTNIRAVFLNARNETEILLHNMVLSEIIASVYADRSYIISRFHKTMHSETVSNIKLFNKVDSAESMNGSRILLQKSEGGAPYYITIPFVFQYCNAESLPNYLSADEKHYQYAQEAKVRCRSSGDSLLKNGIRVDSAKIRCGKHADWDEYSLRCDKGQIIDFTDDNITIVSNKPTIITCAAKDPSNTVSVTFGNATTQKQTRFWSNITIDSDYHGSDIRCKEFDNAGKLLATRQTKMNVLYPPKVFSKHRNFRIEMEAGTSGEIFIHFNSNPAVTCKNIQLFRNGTKLENTYVLVDGIFHKVVVHFIQVDGDVFGSYTMLIKSSPPFNTTVNVRFEISEKSSALSTQSPWSSPSTALAMAFGILLTITITAWITRYYATKENKNSDAGNSVVGVRPKANVQFHNATGSDEDEDDRNYVEIDVAKPQESDSNAYMKPIESVQINQPIDESPYDN